MTISSSQAIKDHALNLLHQMIGEDKDFRPGQWEAIEAVAINRQRALVVQRTGWGKSLVYFLATKLLREQGSGPTILISPLLSLMRNQIEMADRFQIQTHSINSTNTEKWDSIETELLNDKCDLLLISPERLNNEHFLKNTLPLISGRIGLFVVDEAHCISDWGHDFRPDYRRIVRIIQILPKGIPVLGTTATANDRVVADVHTQLGPELSTYRGPLDRKSLHLQNIRLVNQGERLAWLAENLPKFSGSGIVYCMTIADTERVAEWLRQKGFSVNAYHSEIEESEREALEQSFLKNEIKILVATVALGMGFDKPDIEFVIHFQCPGSVVAYYQQVGRAGRSLDNSYGILLSGAEDDEIQNYFIESAFPDTRVFLRILELLENSDGMGLNDILSNLNISKSMVEKALKIMEVEGAIGQAYDKKKLYFRTPNSWKPDTARINRVLKLRRSELEQMHTYVNCTGCLMQFLLEALDDPNSKPCGRCSNCSSTGLPYSVSQEMVIEAESFLRGSHLQINPRKQWPAGLFPGQKQTIPPEYQNALGYSLCYYGDAGWGKLVKSGKYQDGFFCDDLINASVNLIDSFWKPNPRPTWVCAIPSKRHPTLVPELASKIAEKLKIPFIPALCRIKDAPEQKSMQNSTMQSRNVFGTLSVDGTFPVGPVLLVDDIIDSRWTLTMAGFLLRKTGCGIVYPFTLAQATGRNTNG